MPSLIVCNSDRLSIFLTSQLEITASEQVRRACPWNSLQPDVPGPPLASACLLPPAAVSSTDTWGVRNALPGGPQSLPGSVSGTAALDADPGLEFSPFPESRPPWGPGSPAPLRELGENWLSVE